MDSASIFGAPLGPKPGVSLLPLPRPKPEPTGPVHHVQFVVELVGPRSCPAATAAQLLGPQWYSALGEPQIFKMSPADQTWQVLTPATDGSYDSLALAWDLVSDRGRLSSSAASHLLHVAESFAAHIQRRAMAMPSPTDIDRTVAGLVYIQDGLDIGVELLVVPKGADFVEKEVWIALTELGFSLEPSGFFELGNPTREPFLTVTPSGGASQFSLSGVQGEVRHPGLLIGFSVPLSPEPEFSLTAAFRTADYLSQKLNAAIFTDADQILGSTARGQLNANLLAAVRSLASTGINPGSRAARKLFSE
ncbi:MAG TPA: hypothetical protein VJ835_03565 [Fimbriimonadaceae bacterium]|nr:hypothetical protein [Fimbriimonadaceae bacterium]